MIARALLFLTLILSTVRSSRTATGLPSETMLTGGVPPGLAMPGPAIPVSAATKAATILKRANAGPVRAIGKTVPNKSRKVRDIDKGARQC
ncbi:hypothetical protein GCM10023176_28080 [Micromonospora coerulea]|uniref:Secreted protein n=1 Tax=Micromonospora coerulea TaxID=47856 RepID=A0ABP8SIW7_9ACTN